jgi:hypothetical protein
MKHQNKTKTQTITLLLISLVVLLLSLSGCNNSSSATSYARFSSSELQFSIDYPATWQQQVSTSSKTPQVIFSGSVGSSSASIAVVKYNKSYQTLFDQFNQGGHTAVLEFQDKVENNITYSTFTQVIGVVFTRNYVCQLQEGVSILVSASISDSASQDVKDTFNSYAVHMLGSLQ